MVGIEWPHIHEFASLSLRGWLLVIWLGSVSSAFVYFAVARAMTALSATTVMSLDSIVVPLSVMVGWVVLGTAPTLVDAVGGAVVIAGVLLVVHERAPADELSVTPL
jgi:drug/metabolite transporter (DMT)-like permease